MENKFRGFLYGGNRKKYWYGQLVTHENECFLCSFPSGFFVRIPVEKETLQEYTGLKDRKGVDIYTGDVLASVRIDGTVSLHKVFKQTGGFVYNSHDEDFTKPFNKILFTESCSDGQGRGYIRDCEIIGNVIADPDFATS